MSTFEVTPSGPNQERFSAASDSFSFASFSSRALPLSADGEGGVPVPLECLLHPVVSRLLPGEFAAFLLFQVGECVFYREGQPGGEGGHRAVCQQFLDEVRETAQARGRISVTVLGGAIVVRESEVALAFRFRSRDFDSIDTELANKEAAKALLLKIFPDRSIKVIPESDEGRETV